MNHESEMKLTNHRIIALLIAWQFFSILMVSVFNWPREVVWLNLVFLSLFLIFADLYNSLILLIASIPFFVVLPNAYFDSLSIWRPLFGLLFAVWLVRDKGFKIKDVIWMPWDRILGYFVLVSFITILAFAKFPWQGFKQLLFFVNIYLIYVVLINTVKTRAQIYGIIKTAAGSLAVIIALGYAQLIFTFFTDLETFWVFWAHNISRVFYGDDFARVALYSNSWFSYTGGRELRMFSIMPDSQSFAYLSVMAVAFLLPLAFYRFDRRNFWSSPVLGLTALSVLLSGTRAVWAGLLAPLLVIIWLVVKNFYRAFAKKMLWVFAIIVFLFLVSPAVNLGLQTLRYGRQGHFLDRAASIYDLRETSNIGRLLIWKESLANFSKQPWGVGLNNFVTTLSADADIDAALKKINPRYNLPQKYITAHSLYLQILVELGVAGIIIFVWFWARVGKVILEFLSRHKPSGFAAASFLSTFKDNSACNAGADAGGGVSRAGRDYTFLVFWVFASAVAFLWLLTAAAFDVTWFNDRVLMYFFVMLGLAGVVAQNYEVLK